jgi:hypothetical protein
MMTGARGTGQQHVVGRAAGDELPGVLRDLLLLRADVLQVVERDRRDVPHRLQVAAAIALAPAEGVAGIPVGRGAGLRQQGFDALQQGFGAGQEGVELGHDGNAAPAGAASEGRVGFRNGSRR